MQEPIQVEYYTVSRFKALPAYISPENTLAFYHQRRSITTKSFIYTLV
jgi:hypothetical protein